MQDPYCYEGTNVLKNKLGITNQDKLDRVERRITKQRMRQITENYVKGNYNLSHLQAIHKFIFQDLYDWAGEIRKVDIAKGNLFCKYDYIEAMAAEIFGELKRENYLQGLGKEELAERLAYYLSEINALHPFREGNGRTQREFIRQLAFADGYILSYAGISREEMIAASKASFMRDYRQMRELILFRLRPLSW